MNPNRLKPYIKAREKKEEKMMDNYDIVAWLIGQYVCEATAVAITNTIGGKKAEYSRKPRTILEQEKSEDRYINMSEEEKLIEVKNIFSRLTSVEARIQMGGE